MGLNIYTTRYYNYLRIFQWYYYTHSNRICDWCMSTQWHSLTRTDQITYTKHLVSFLDSIVIQYDNRILLIFSTEIGIRCQIISMKVVSCLKDRFVSVKVTKYSASCNYFHLTAYVYFIILTFCMNCPLILVFILKLYK